MKSFFYQSPDGYCYNSDTIFLFDFLSNFKLKGKVLDVGTGVGVLPVLIAKYFNVKLYAVEVQEIMYKYAKKNFEINNVDVNLFLTDFLEFETENRFDFIVSNPPFYKVDKHKSPNRSLAIARYEEFLPLEKFIKRVSSLLTPRGYFIFCYDAFYTDEILELLRVNKIKPEFIKFVHPKANSEANLVMITSRKSSRSVCKILPPLIVFDSNNNYTQEARDIFFKTNTHSFKAFYD